MSDIHSFKAIIEDAGRGGAFVTVPFDAEQVFGKKRVKVKATIDGEAYRGTLVRMGTPSHILIVLKDIRTKIGKTIGDEVEVTLQEDTEQRIVRVPSDLQQALAKHPQAQATFQHLSYTHKKEYVNWLNEAKREETRRKRIARAIEMLQEGRKGW
ncbi:MAG: YdeI/OmpD-associated family protein [Chloroflexota bacterium]